MPSRAAKNRQAGITLIEVLVAVVVLAIGLLGLAGLQTSALTNTSISYQYTQAAILAQGMAERMRANRAAVVTSASPYALAAGGTPTVSKNCNAAACTSAELAAWDLATWYASIDPSYDPSSSNTNIPKGPRGLLPGGKASVVCADATCTATSIWMITIYWDADRSARTGYGCDPASGSDLRCFRLAYRPGSS